MNARTVSALLVALAMNGVLFADAEAKEPIVAVAETEAASEGLPEAAQSATNNFNVKGLLSSPDSWDVRVTDGMFETPSSPAFKIMGAGMFIASGADLASTEYALTRPDVHELNPVQGNRNVRMVTHAAVPALMYYVTEKIHDNGKPKLALIARIGFTIVYSYAVMHNMRAAQLGR